MISQVRTTINAAQKSQAEEEWQDVAVNFSEHSLPINVLLHRESVLLWDSVWLCLSRIKVQCLRGFSKILTPAIHGLQVHSKLILHRWKDIGLLTSQCKRPREASPRMDSITSSGSLSREILLE